MRELKIIESKKLMNVASKLTNSRIIGTQILVWLFVHDVDYWKIHKENESIKWTHENIHYAQARELLF